MKSCSRTSHLFHTNTVFFCPNLRACVSTLSLRFCLISSRSSSLERASDLCQWGSRGPCHSRGPTTVFAGSLGSDSLSPSLSLSLSLCISLSILSLSLSDSLCICPCFSPSLYISACLSACIIMRTTRVQMYVVLVQIYLYIYIYINRERYNVYIYRTTCLYIYLAEYQDSRRFGCAVAYSITTLIWPLRAAILKVFRQDESQALEATDLAHDGCNDLSYVFCTFWALVASNDKQTAKGELAAWLRHTCKSTTTHPDMTSSRIPEPLRRTRMLQARGEKHPLKRTERLSAMLHDILQPLELDNISRSWTCESAGPGEVREE